MKIAIAGLVLILGLGLLPACGGSDDYTDSPAASQPEPVRIQPRPMTDKQAERLLISRCVGCHTTDRIKKRFRGGVGDWTVRVERCQAKSGAVTIPAVDQVSLINWLAKKYGP